MCKVYPEDVAMEIGLPDFPGLIEQFIYNQQHPDNASDDSSLNFPTFYSKIMIYPSAVATFHAPSDISGVGGMRRKHIHAVKSWRKGAGCYDTIFINTNSSMEGMGGLDVAHTQLFFHFLMRASNTHAPLSSGSDELMGMWKVEPDQDQTLAVIHLDTIVQAAHLPVFGPGCVSRSLSFTNTLDTFHRFYVNKYVDHHVFEIAH